MKLSFIGDLTVDVYSQQNKILLGGASLTSAMWAKKLGAECTILAAVGNDKAGKSYKKFFKENNFSLKTLITLKAPTSRIEIFIDQNGEHTFDDWQPGAYAQYHLGKKEMDFLKTQDAVVMPLYAKTKHLLDEVIKINKANDHAQRGQIPLSGMTNDQYQIKNSPLENPKPLIIIDFDDLSQFDKSTKIIEDYLPYIDIVKLGLDINIDRKLIAEIKQLATSSCSPNIPNIPKLPKLFLITLNKNGSVVFCQSKEYWQKADKIIVKNTTGAGDAFIAGFLADYLNSKNIQTALKLGTKTASRLIIQQSAY